MDVSFLIVQIQPLLGWLAVISLLTFITSLLLIPLIVRRLPVDIFVRRNTSSDNNPALSPVRILFVLLKNFVAILLVVSGFSMLFIPGQGLLTMLIGFLLLSFPGKHKIITYLIHKQSIQKSLDWIRIKQHYPPFHWPE